jgi:hypothetical protein
MEKILKSCTLLRRAKTTGVINTILSYRSPDMSGLRDVISEVEQRGVLGKYRPYSPSIIEAIAIEVVWFRHLTTVRDDTEKFSDMDFCLAKIATLCARLKDPQEITASEIVEHVLPRLDFVLDFLTCIYDLNKVLE